MGELSVLGELLIRWELLVMRELLAMWKSLTFEKSLVMVGEFLLSSFLLLLKNSSLAWRTAALSGTENFLVMLALRISSRGGALAGPPASRPLEARLEARKERGVLVKSKLAGPETDCTLCFT